MTTQTDETVSVTATEIYEAQRIVLCWRLHALSDGSQDYLDWTATKFPVVYKGLMETLPAWIERGAARQVPLELFEAMIECVVNGHRQAFLLWKFSQAGQAVSFEPMPGGLVQ